MTASLGQAGDAAVTGAAYTSFLAQLPFFVGVPAEELSSFANTVLVRQLPAGTDVVVQRQYGHAMFVLMSGAVVVHAIGADDVSVTLGRLARPGDFFGEAALLGRGERTATVTATSPMSLLVLSRNDFNTMLSTAMPHVAPKLLQVMGQRIRELAQHAGNPLPY